MQEPQQSIIGNLAASVPAFDAGWATLIAGVLALVAGALVYWAALSTLREEKRRSEEDGRRRKLNLYLTAEHMAYVLCEVAPVREHAVTLSFTLISDDGLPIPGEVPGASVRIPRPKQLEELWNNLSDFSANIIHELREITKAFDAAEDYLENRQTVPDDGKSPLVGYYFAISDSAFILKEIVSKTDLVKYGSAKDPDRNILLHGLPDDTV
jgi:hypothetical protein